ncbi:hypothetical protein [Metaclostridioides mangenotii]|uniref:hypothetical protein n=1 Tax=Metaclostridioides mangenotii TaxID=1540 RepID=UPI0004634FFB|nr:hypothetical protein [Clostridioides mangenotii]
MKPETIFQFENEQKTERITIDVIDEKFYIEIDESDWDITGAICLNEEQILKLANSILIHSLSKCLGVRGR